MNVSVPTKDPDTIFLQMAETLCPAQKQLVSDLLIFHVHLKVRLGISDDLFYEKLMRTLLACRGKNDQKAFLLLFMREMETVSGMEMTEIVRMLQASLLLKRDQLKVVTLPFWRETFAAF